MRAKHLAASCVAALALAARPGVPHAELASVSRPFSLGEPSIERRVESALRVGQFDCDGCFEGSGFTLVAWDLSVALPVTDRAALFVLQPILFRSSGDPVGASHKFPGALTFGARHAGLVGPELSLATAVSVSLPYPGGGEAGVTTRLAGNMIDDSSLYTTGGGTFRIELDVRRQWAPLFAQAQLAVAAHSNDNGLHGSSRVGVGAGVQLRERAAFLFELTALLGAGQIACEHCVGERPREGTGRPVLSVGGRVALGPCGLGARGLLPLTDTADQEARPSMSVTIDARF